MIFLSAELLIHIAVHIFIRLGKLAVAILLLYRRLRYGYPFRRIPMAGPKYAIVDPADYERLRKYEWFARKGKNSFYARRYEARGKGKKETLVYMHQEIIKVPKGMMVDHINHDSMDNRRANLRAATTSQNSYNRKKLSRQCSSKYKGVWWHKSSLKWQARIIFEKKRIHLGTFKNEIDAAKAYDEAARKYHGEFACLNFPEQ